MGLLPQTLPVKENKVQIDFGRCLCIHSMLQMVDVTMQIISFSRGFIPQTYQLLCRDESVPSRKFCENYSSIMSELREVFRSINRNLLTNVLVIIGSNYFTPLEVFDVKVEPCANHEHDIKLDGDVTVTCAQNCGELSQRERRRIYTSLILDNNNNAPGHRMSKNAKIFVMVKAKNKLNKTAKGIEFDQDFEPPSPEGIRKRHGQMTFIDTANICGLTAPCIEESTGYWYRLSHSLSSIG
ncbi:unnamed protein product [Bursaphelenchus xylophilus]|uniref:(pine wood nematode) hypothetical protein n=1 Tax=Bursaphelenchus xylophilus TaxID=6326 RepID=A0A1I7SBZ8_BURXY|nr:unnamed protein product [Bursaphelenchus xylophilus]CAG9088979.1 unnamed protein product [Bursaphelenchus xylophilus]